MIRRLGTNRINNFEKWLKQLGAEIIPATNPYELLRFNCKHGTGVIYKGKRGISVSAPFVTEAIDCFLTAKKWDGRFNSTKRNVSKQIRQLLARDGNKCFYCNQEMNDNEMSEEHLLSLIHGGSNRMENKVLAHKECNNIAGHKTVFEKVKLRENWN